MFVSASFMSWSTIFSLLLCFTSSLTNAITKSGAKLITAWSGIVATDETQCSKVGRDVLRAGGHAVDASIAAALCLGVISPGSSGLGGGGFMLVRSSGGKAKALDMRETAPIQASQDMYHRNPTQRASGAFSIAVPGELAGLYKAWKEYGKLPWNRLVSSDENLARKGFQISPYLYKQMASVESRIKADKGLREIFAPKGSLLQKNQTIRNIKLANTLAAISKNGSDVFYNGRNLITDIRDAGGILTMEDLQRYQVKVREPITAHVMGLKIYGVPPPASGSATMVLILKILAPYTNNSGSLGIHREIEALKHALAMRMNLGDPDFVDVKSVLTSMLSTSFAARLTNTINDNKTFNSSYYGGKWKQIRDHGTSHLCVVDRERNAVSMTTSINSYFGADFLSPSTGIVLNNQMYDFAVPSYDVPPPAPTNFIRPSKRPLSSMAPTIIIKDGRLRAVLGAAGGGSIPAGTAEVFLNNFARKMGPLSSVVAPRYYHMLNPNVLYYENFTSVFGDRYEAPADTKAALEKKGHALRSATGWTICQFIVQELQGPKSARLLAVSDPRKGGLPAGY